MLLIALAYWPAVHNEFINYDDDDYVVENELVNQGLTVNGMHWAMTSLDRANWHPLTWISHMIDCQIFGLKPAGHHLVNVGLHAINSILLYCILLRMTQAAWPSIVVAAFFAVHPLHVESVAWVAERKDVLSTLFGMLALSAWISYLAQPSRLRYAAVMLWFAASLMSKPMWVTLPFLLLLLDYWPLGRIQGAGSRGQGAGSREQGAKRTSIAVAAGRLAIEKLPLLLLSGASCVVTMIAQYYGQRRGVAGRHTPGARLATVVEAYCGYLWKMAVPLNLAPIYPISKSGRFSGRYRLRRRPSRRQHYMCVLAGRARKHLAVGWLWYLGTLVPVIGIVQVGYQSMADRYTYLPLVGIFILLAWIGVEVIAHWPSLKAPLAALTLAMLAACCLLTNAQVRRWQSTETLFTHTITVTPDNPVALTNLGLVALHKQNYVEAKRLLDEALNNDPGNIDAMGNLASMYVNQKEYVKAIDTYQAMLRPGLSGDRTSKVFAQMARAYRIPGRPRPCGDLYGKMPLDLEPASFSLLYPAWRSASKCKARRKRPSITMRKSSASSRANVEASIISHGFMLRIRPRNFAMGPRPSNFYCPLPPNSRTIRIRRTFWIPWPQLMPRQADSTKPGKRQRLLSRAARQENKPSQTIADIQKRARLYQKDLPYRDPQLLSPSKCRICEPMHPEPESQIFLTPQYAWYIDLLIGIRFSGFSCHWLSIGRMVY